MVCTFAAIRFLTFDMFHSFLCLISLQIGWSGRVSTPNKSTEQLNTHTKPLCGYNCRALVLNVRTPNLLWSRLASGVLLSKQIMQSFAFKGFSKPMCQWKTQIVFHGVNTPWGRHVWWTPAVTPTKRLWNSTLQSNYKSTSVTSEAQGHFKRLTFQPLLSFPLLPYISLLSH